MAEETPAELREKLETFKDQISQLDVFLQDDPENEEVLKAKSDLEDIIKLTSSLLATALEREQAAAQQLLMQQQAEQRRAAAAAAPAVVIPPIPTTQQPLQQTQQIPSQYSSQSKSYFLQQTGVKIVPMFQIGQKVMAKYGDGMYYEAKVEKVPTYAGEKYTVNYLGYNETAELATDEVTAIKVADKAQKQQGIKHKRDDESGSGGGVGSTNADGKDFVIPKALRILPTDPEEVQKTKKRKIHAIKNQNRLKKLEEERNQSKNTWQSFVNKSGAPKSSIFKSPDSVTGKVGVMNSGIVNSQVGKPVTIKRWRKNEAGEDVEISDEEQDDE